MSIQTDIVILGASPNPNGISNTVVRYLKNKGMRVWPVSVTNQATDKAHSTNVYSDEILQEIEKVDTVSIFINPTRQKKYYDYLLQIKPRCIVFNPGTENEELIQLATKHHIKIVKGCTIAMYISGIL